MCALCFYNSVVYACHTSVKHGRGANYCDANCLRDWIFIARQNLFLCFISSLIITHSIHAFAYIYHKNWPNVGKIYHTWIQWLVYNHGMTWLSWWFNSLPTVCTKEELGVQAPVGFWVTWKDLEVEKCHDWNWQSHDKLGDFARESSEHALTMQV